MSRRSRSMGEWSTSWLGVAAVYCAGTLLFLWPLPLDPGGTIWGDRFDAWTTLWLIGHLADGIREGTLQAQTHAILYPIGYSLWSFGHAALQLIGALAVAAGVPLVWAYNLSLWLGLVTSGLAAHLLGREVTGSHLAGFVAGFLFCTSPYLYGEGAAGCIELVAAGLLPLHMWSLVRLVRALEPPGRPWGAWLRAVVLLALIGPFNWYYTLFAGMAGVGFCLWQAAERRWRAAGWLAASFALAGAIDAPMIPLVRQETPTRPPISAATFTDTANWEASNALADAQRPVGSLTPELLELHDAMQVIRNSTQLRSLAAADFVVNPLKSTPGRLIYTMGLIGVLLGGRRTRGWGWMALGATVLTLGPFLTLDDSPPLPDWAGRLPLPYWFGYEYLPFFSKAYRPYRIGVIAMECLAVAAAVGVCRLGEGRAVRGTVALLGIWAFAQPLVAGERPAWRGTAAAAFPAVYQSLRAMPEGAVIELPLQYQPLTVGNARFQYWQLAHGKPLLNCNQLIRRPDLLAFRDYVTQNSFLLVLMDLARRTPPFAFRRSDVAKLYTEGFRYIVLHREVPADAVQLAGPMGEADLIGEPAIGMLRDLFGAPILAGDGAEIYGLPAEQVGGAGGDIVRVDGQRVIDLELPFAGQLALVLEGESIRLYSGEPVAGVSIWLHGLEGRAVRLRAVRAAGEPIVREVTMKEGVWQHWEEVLGGGVTPGVTEVWLEAPPGERARVELQRVQILRE